MYNDSLFNSFARSFEARVGSISSFWTAPTTSGPPSIPDLGEIRERVRLVPRRGMRRRKLLKRKSRPMAVLNSNLMIVDQAAINDGYICGHPKFRAHDRQPRGIVRKRRDRHHSLNVGSMHPPADPRKGPIGRTLGTVGEVPAPGIGSDRID
jgi:hypothetical protein